MIFFHIIRYQSLYLFKPFTFWFFFVCFILNALLSYFLYSSFMPIDNLKATTFVFYLPINISIDVFRIILLILPFLLFYNMNIQREMEERSVYILLRIKSFKIWFHSLMLITFIFTFSFILLGYLITYGIVSFLPSHEYIITFNKLQLENNLFYLLEQYILLSLSLVLILFLNTLFIFLIENIEVSTILTLLVLLIPTVIGNLSPQTTTYFPTTYGFFVFKENKDFSFFTEFSTLLFCIFVTYMTTYLIFYHKKETLLLLKR